MEQNEQKLSDFIDSLNEEKKPKENEFTTDSDELKELYQTVKMVRSLREPAMPEANSHKKISAVVEEKLSRKNSAKRNKWSWYTGMASVAAVLVFLLNFVLPFGNSNIVSAMEDAFKDVKSYHGVLEIVETDDLGESTTQAKLEVWANKDGQYNIKGLAGTFKGLTTVNNGEKKWQIRPSEEEVHVFPSFPDPYRFTFELGNEIENVKAAASTKVVGEDVVAGRQATILEVTPKGGEPYKIWVDEETKLPLQKQYAMHNAIQYTITYAEIEFNDRIPAELIAYEVPAGFEEINTNPEQVINDLSEFQEVLGFTPKLPETLPNGYIQESIAIIPNQKLIKVYYSSKTNTIAFLQGEADGELVPAPTAILGKVNGNPAEIQSPVYENVGILGGGGTYAGVTDISSIRWQENGFEYALVGDATLEELGTFVASLTNGAFEMPSLDDQVEPQVEVEYDLTVEENTQKSVDAGSSPWKLNPVAVAQVFVSLEISPEGITGEYPVKEEELQVVNNTGNDAVVAVDSDKTTINKIYLKRVVRQDSTGIWTVVGYDQAE